MNDRDHAAPARRSRRHSLVRSNAWRRTLSRRAGRRPRGLSLTCGKRDNLEISPNLWAGVRLVRGGAGAALVGDPRTVAERLKEYMGVGVDRFILSGYPHLGECYRFAEQVFLLLPLRATTGVERAAVRGAGSFGEIIANVVPPTKLALQS